MPPKYGSSQGVLNVVLGCFFQNLLKTSVIHSRPHPDLTPRRELDTNQAWSPRKHLLDPPGFGSAMLTTRPSSLPPAGRPNRANFKKNYFYCVLAHAHYHVTALILSDYHTSRSSMLATWQQQQWAYVICRRYQRVITDYRGVKRTWWPFSDTYMPRKRQYIRLRTVLVGWVVDWSLSELYR